jgi:hypothetical protein
VTLRAGNTRVEAVAPEWIVVLSWLMSHAADSGERLLQAGMLFRDIPALAAETLPDAGVLFQGPAGCQDAGVERTASSQAGNVHASGAMWRTAERSAW